MENPAAKYRPFPPVHLPDRTWPNQTITQAPIWLSADLRDGNQALIEPMDVARKLKMFDLLLQIGFKEIEVSFPSASQTDFDFVRMLIEGNRIPADVRIQVLTAARAELIQRTFESLQGAHSAIVHLYNATCPLFRRVVFKQDQQQTIQMAVESAKLFNELAAKQPETHWTFQYSPELFVATEPEFALKICNAVLDVWQPTPQHKAILNLPATVEVATPNIYADQIEWFCRHLTRRDSVIISLHAHNDRGCATAATELGLMAGADRVEGCLFGNGERTGNVDIIQLAMNLYTQGVDPKLDLSDINQIMQVTEYCTQMSIHPRHPYAGELVYAAFSGSHQDAIKKGFVAQEGQPLWEVPYLPLDPKDVGRNYEAIIRINSQSGKGGMAYLLEHEYGLELPRTLQVEFSKHVQQLADSSSKEITAALLWKVFQDEYLTPGVLTLSDVQFNIESNSEVCYLSARIMHEDVQHTIEGTGNGPVAAFNKALSQYLQITLDVQGYNEHARGRGAEATAVAYVDMLVGKQRVFGVGIHPNIVRATLQAVVSGVNRVLSRA